MHNVYWHENKYLTKVSVTSGNTFHTFHVAFLPRPEKLNTVSQSVNVSHIGKALHVSSPRLYAILHIGRYFRFGQPQTQPIIRLNSRKKMTKSNDHNIGVNSDNKNIFISLGAIFYSVKNNMSVSLFVVAMINSIHILLVLL